MISLSNHEQGNAQIQALRIMACRDNRTLTDKAAAKTDKEQAVLSLMSLNWAPSVLKAIGSRPLNLLLRRLRDDVLPAEVYRSFADMIVRATDEALPNLHSPRILWRALITRFHLYEISDFGDWISLIARFDARGIRSPLCLRRIPVGELIKPDWEPRIRACCSGWGYSPTYLSVRGIYDGSGFPAPNFLPSDG